MALPQLGVQAIFLIDKFQRNAKRYDKILGQSEKAGKKLADSTAKSTGTMAKSFHELIQKSRELQNAMAQMSGKQQANLIDSLNAAFDKLGGTAGIDVGIFDKLAGSGKGMEAAFQGASKGVSGLGGAASGAAASALTLGAVLAGVGVAIGVVVKGTTMLIGIIKDSISVFQENALELRNFQLQLGGSTEEISAMMVTARALGVQMRDLAAGWGMFEKKLVDYELRVAAGSEASHEFERAMGVLGVSVKDAGGDLRTMVDLMPDIADAFAELGPGVTTTGLAMNLFGRTGRRLLPFLLEGREGLEEFMEIAEKTGAIMTSKDVAAAVEFKKSMTELELSIEGVKNMLARHFLPVLKDGAGLLSEWVQGAKNLAIGLTAVATAGLAAGAVLMKTNDKYLAATAGLAAFEAQVRNLTGALTEQEKAEEALEEAQHKRAQAVARAKGARITIREDIAELEEQLDERRLAAKLAFEEQWKDIETARARELADAETQEARKREDLWRAYQRRLNDILDEYNKKRRERDEENRKKWADFEAWANLQREKLLNRHLERMEAIKERFQATADEAARRNDAVALLRAMRQRVLDEKLERTRYANRRDELEKDIALKRKKLEDAIKKQRDDDKARLDDAIARAKKAYKRQLEDLAIALARQEEDRKLSQLRQKADYDLAILRRYEATSRWYDKEKEALETKLAVQNAIISGSEEDRLNAVKQFNADLEELLGERYDMEESMARQHYGRMAVMGQLPGMRPPSGAPLPPMLPGMRPPSGAPLPSYSRAEGGIDIVSKPTHYIAGDAGREMAAFIPMGGNVHHTFDRLGMDVGGVSSATEAQMAPLMISLLQQMVRQIR